MRLKITVLCLAAISAIACADKNDGEGISTLTGPSPVALTNLAEDVGPKGPASMTFSVQKASNGVATSRNLRFGAEIKRGLFKQPPPADTLINVELYNYSCPVANKHIVPVNNSEWSLNADSSLLVDNAICNNEAFFELHITTSSGFTTWHELTDPIMIEDFGVVPGSMKVIHDAITGHARLTFKLQ